ncbi:serine/threonine-protein kinase [Streptomyces sp. NPDC059982]|uniref:serine/threonine-protein kinase n=1 Tax=unclassified Streptomyces TaxID=2593676 RepID=UPI0036BABB56
MIEPIASGGMGRVWRASDARLQVEVAVKELWLTGPMSPAQRDTLLRRAELEALSAVRLRDHPHIVTVHDVVVEHDVPWIVMQLVSGGTLQQRLESGPLPVAEAAALAVALLGALRAAHAQGIVHRDVKPANVMISTAGQVLLADFGISAPESGTGLTSTGIVIGSAPYIAPERAVGQPGGASSDLFSLGVTLYEAVEGLSPFLRDSPVASVHAVQYDPYPPLHRAGPLTALIAGLLAKDPRARLTIDQALSLLERAAERVPPDRAGAAHAPTQDAGQAPTQDAGQAAGHAPAQDAEPAGPPLPPGPEQGPALVSLRITNLSRGPVRARLGVSDLGEIAGAATAGYTVEPFSARTLRVTAPASGLTMASRVLRPETGKPVEVTVHREGTELRLTGAGAPERPARRTPVRQPVRPPAPAAPAAQAKPRARPARPAPPPQTAPASPGATIAKAVAVTLLIAFGAYTGTSGFSGWVSHYLHAGAASSRTGDCLYRDTRQKAGPGAVATADGYVWVKVPCWSAAGQYEVRTDPRYTSDVTLAPPCSSGSKVVWLSAGTGGATSTNGFTSGTYVCAAST